MEQCKSNVTAPVLLPSICRPRRTLLAERALRDVHAGRTQTWAPFKVPDVGDWLRISRSCPGCALASHGDKRMAKLRIIIPILLPAGLPVLGTHSEYQDLMRMQSRTPQFLKRTGRIKLRESTLCGWYGASIPVCHVVPICTCAMAKCWRPGIHLCLAIRSGQRPRTTFHRQER